MRHRRLMEERKRVGSAMPERRSVYRKGEVSVKRRLRKMREEKKLRRSKPADQGMDVALPRDRIG